MNRPLYEIARHRVRVETATPGQDGVDGQDGADGENARTMFPQFAARGWIYPIEYDGFTPTVWTAGLVFPGIDSEGVYWDQRPSLTCTLPTAGISAARLPMTLTWGYTSGTAEVLEKTLPAGSWRVDGSPPGVPSWNSSKWLLEVDTRSDPAATVQRITALNGTFAEFVRIGTHVTTDPLHPWPGTGFNVTWGPWRSSVFGNAAGLVAIDGGAP